MITTAGVFGNTYHKDQHAFLEKTFDLLHKAGIRLVFFEPYYLLLKPHFKSLPCNSVFGPNDCLPDIFRYLFSFGGDGTFLQTLPLVKDTGIPVLGFNTGRLGFLSGVGRDEVPEVVEMLLKGKFNVESRGLIMLQDDKKRFEGFPYALNEISLHKKDSSSMISIHVHVDGSFLNTYWADGLIIATPTGSTAYSLSCGGPILTPSSESFIITPISIHNLTVRPIVIPDTSKITIQVEGRSKNFLMTIDSRSALYPINEKINISKGDVTARLIQPEGKNFFSTLREKLMWGSDKRN